MCPNENASHCKSRFTAVTKKEFRPVQSLARHNVCYSQLSPLLGHDGVGVVTPSAMMSSKIGRQGDIFRRRCNAAAIVVTRAPGPARFRERRSRRSVALWARRRARPARATTRPRPREETPAGGWRWAAACLEQQQQPVWRLLSRGGWRWSAARMIRAMNHLA